VEHRQLPQLRSKDETKNIHILDDFCGLCGYTAPYCGCSYFEWKALDELWYIESRWDYTADNPRSTAYGIPQLLKMDPKTPLIKQIDLGLKYIKHRYGTPTKALKFHNRHGWY